MGEHIMVSSFEEISIDVSDMGRLLDVGYNQ
jgi:hypothetical protein